MARVLVVRPRGISAAYGTARSPVSMARGCRRRQKREKASVLSYGNMVLSKS